MPIIANELVPDHLYHIIVEGRVKPSEIAAVLKEFQPILDRSDRPLVHFILNMQTSEHYPHLGEIYRVLNPYLSQTKLGWFIVYRLDEKMPAFMFGVMANIFKLRVRHLANYAESLNFIQSVDSTLGTWSADLVPEPLLLRQELA